MASGCLFRNSGVLLTQNGCDTRYNHVVNLRLRQNSKKWVSIHVSHEPCHNNCHAPEFKVKLNNLLVWLMYKKNNVQDVPTEKIYNIQANNQIFRHRGLNKLKSSAMFSSTRPRLALSSRMIETTTAPVLPCSMIEFAAQVIEYFDEPRPSLDACNPYRGN